MKTDDLKLTVATWNILMNEDYENNYQDFIKYDNEKSNLQAFIRAVTTIYTIYKSEKDLWLLQEADVKFQRILVKLQISAMTLNQDEFLKYFGEQVNLCVKHGKPLKKTESIGKSCRNFFLRYGIVVTLFNTQLCYIYNKQKLKFLSDIDHYWSNLLLPLLEGSDENYETIKAKYHNWSYNKYTFAEHFIRNEQPLLKSGLYYTISDEKESASLQAELHITDKSELKFYETFSMSMLSKLHCAKFKLLQTEETIDVINAHLSPSNFESNQWQYDILHNTVDYWFDNAAKSHKVTHLIIGGDFNTPCTTNIFKRIKNSSNIKTFTTNATKIRRTNLKTRLDCIDHIYVSSSINIKDEGRIETISGASVDRLKWRSLLGPKYKPWKRKYVKSVPDVCETFWKTWPSDHSIKYLTLSIDITPSTKEEEIYTSSLSSLPDLQQLGLNTQELLSYNGSDFDYDIF